MSTSAIAGLVHIIVLQGAITVISINAETLSNTSPFILHLANAHDGAAAADGQVHILPLMVALAIRLIVL